MTIYISNFPIDEFNVLPVTDPVPHAAQRAQKSSSDAEVEFVGMKGKLTMPAQQIG